MNADKSSQVGRRQFLKGAGPAHHPQSSPACDRLLRLISFRSLETLSFFLIGAAWLSGHACAQDSSLNIQRDIPYTESADPFQKLDVYAPAGAINLPVVVWIHGGGWQQGDKAEMKEKPVAFARKGFVFVSVNYRLWPKVPMGDIVRDCAEVDSLGA